MSRLMIEPWPWWVAGPLIGLIVPFVYWYGGRKWGVSSSLQHFCAATIPAGLDYFRYDWRQRGPAHFAMVIGMIIGAYLAARVIAPPELLVNIAPSTRDDLLALGLRDLTGLVPSEIFNWRTLLRPVGIIVVVGGGFLVGFGARYAEGCTSGHAISGLANLQIGSLAAVLGFFVGGLVSTWVLLPVIL